MEAGGDPGAASFGEPFRRGTSLFPVGVRGTEAGQGREPLGGMATPAPRSPCDETGWGAPASRALGWGRVNQGCLGSP